MPDHLSGRPRVALFVTCLADTIRPRLSFAALPGQTHEQPWVKIAGSYLTDMHLPDGSGEGLSTILIRPLDETVPLVRSHA